MKGVGIDAVEISRFNDKEESFLERMFTREERKYCNSKEKPAQHFAGRFVAKEAVFKSIDNKKDVGLSEIEIRNLEGGKPAVYLKNKQQENLQISITHTKNIAMAIAFKV